MYNTEFRQDGEWYAQHTGVAGQGDVIDKARALFRWKLDELGCRFGGVRITEGAPFGTVVARCNRVGAVKWHGHNDKGQRTRTSAASEVSAAPDCCAPFGGSDADH